MGGGGVRSPPAPSTVSKRTRSLEKFLNLSLFRRLSLTAAFLGLSLAASAQLAPAPNYANPANWVCRPGSEDICTANLDAVAIDASGKRAVQHFVPASNPPVDCFYVYPTVSREQMPYADLTDSPEIQRTVNAQAGRLTSRCRLFAPIYRQATLKHLHDRLGGEAGIQTDIPQQDIEAAWLYYLQHDNHGRGVIIIGHSQGTILLQAMMAKLIDGKPSQSLLISAFLAGDPSLGVPPGADVGGTFAHIPVCRAAAQTGCVYAWGSYLDDDASPRLTFGKPRNDGLVSACSNPVAPSGGTGTLKFYHLKRANESADNIPWVENVGPYIGACRSTASGNAFRITVSDGPLAAEYRALLEKSSSRESWGLHPLDLSLVQGNILDVMDSEISAWHKTR